MELKITKDWQLIDGLIEGNAYKLCPYHDLTELYVSETSDIPDDSAIGIAYLKLEKEVIVGTADKYFFVRNTTKDCILAYFDIGVSGSGFIKEYGTIIEFKGAVPPKGFVFCYGGYVEFDKHEYLLDKLPLITPTSKSVVPKMWNNFGTENLGYTVPRNRSDLAYGEYGWKIFDKDDETYDLFYRGYKTSWGRDGCCVEINPLIAGSMYFDRIRLKVGSGAFDSKISKTKRLLSILPFNMQEKTVDKAWTIEYPYSGYDYKGVIVPDNQKYDLEFIHPTGTQLWEQYLNFYFSETDFRTDINLYMPVPIYSIEVFCTDLPRGTRYFQIPTVLDEEGLPKIIFIGDNTEVIYRTGIYNLDKELLLRK